MGVLRLTLILLACWMAARAVRGREEKDEAAA
jgi:cbb3-type cytochrome oxidase subunit 3